jgi:ABC-type nickel/cobalt efflux system permease component RcnA
MDDKAVSKGRLCGTVTTCLEIAREWPAWTQRRRRAGVAPVVTKCKETDAMKIDVKLREELAQKLYAESDRTGVAWVRRPESVKHAFREAAERKLRIHTENHVGHDHNHNHGHGHGHNHAHGNHERTRHTVGTHRTVEAGQTKGKPVTESCTR